MPSTPQKLPYVFAASDMDGTLLRDDHTLSSTTLATIRRITYDMRLPFIVATGRPHPNVLYKVRKELKLKACYVISSNGARVHNMDDDVVFSADIPAEAARTIAMLASPNAQENAHDDVFAEVATSIYQGDRWFMNKHAKDLTEFYEDLKEVYFYELFDPATHSSYEGVYKVYFTSHTNPAALDTLAAQIKRLPCASEVTVVQTLPYCLEVMAKGVDKGAALARLLDETIYPDSDPSGLLTPEQRRRRLLERCIAFGDGANDYGMLTAVGKGCVMANATKDLVRLMEAYNKAHPTSSQLERIKSNEEDAVAEKLREVFYITDDDLARTSAKQSSLSKTYKVLALQLLFLFVVWYVLRNRFV